MERARSSEPGTGYTGGMAEKPTIILRGKRFDVEMRDVPTRDGQSEQREVVVHPGAVVVLPLLADGRVVLIRNRRFSIEQTLWELPAGTREAGEDPAVCAAREVEEETGYRAGTLAPLLDFYTAPGISTELMHAFIATDLSQTQQRLDATEQIAVHPVAQDQLLQMILTGEVVDAKTLATFLFFRARGQLAQRG